MKLLTLREWEHRLYTREPDEVGPSLDVALEESFKDGDWASFLSAVGSAVDAKGGIGKLARKLKCSRTSLYKTLSKKGNPRLDTLGAILRALGLRLSIQPGPWIDEASDLPRLKRGKATAKRAVKKSAPRPKPRAKATVVRAPAKAKRIATKRG